MFLLVVDRWLGRIRQPGRQAVPVINDRVKRLEAFLDPGVSETKQASAEFMVDVRSYLLAKQMLARHQQERMRFLEDTVADGIASGGFKDVHPYLVAEVLLSAVTRIDELDFKGQAGLTFSVVLDELYELLLHGLMRD